MILAFCIRFSLLEVELKGSFMHVCFHLITSGNSGRSSHKISYCVLINKHFQTREVVVQSLHITVHSVPVRKLQFSNEKNIKEGSVVRTNANCYLMLTQEY